jgi:hypothetical protein
MKIEQFSSRGSVLIDQLCNYVLRVRESGRGGMKQTFT